MKPSLVYISFTIVSVTGPVLGVIIGGNLTSYLGGYTTKKSILQTLAFSYMCLFSSIPIPFLSGHLWIVFMIFLWLLLFFGGAILPSLTGIMLNTVADEQKTVANSIAAVLFNVLGYLPSPLVYGFLAQSGGN